MNAVYAKIAQDFPDHERWNDMGKDARVREIQQILSRAFVGADLPPLKITTQTVGPLGVYLGGTWTMAINPFSMKSGEERQLDRAAALARAEADAKEYGMDPEERTQVVNAVFDSTFLSRDGILGVLVHECQHALQEYFRLSWLAARHKGPLSVLDEKHGLKGEIVDGEPIYGTDEVWKVAQAHPTIANPYVDNIVNSRKIDREYDERQKAVGTSEEQNALVLERYGDWENGKRGDPFGREDNAEEAAWNTVACENVMKR